MKARDSAIPTTTIPAPVAETLGMDVAAPRKLVRPSLPASWRPGQTGSLRTGPAARRAAPFPARTALTSSEFLASSLPATQAETFYLQKQVQEKTLMVFVLEGEEKIEGIIEWYDQNVIKVRNGSRTLIFKSSIKYLYKRGEGRQI